MKTTIVWLIAALIFSALLVSVSAECEDCLDHRLCQSPTECHSGCQCIPLPGRSVGQCQ